MNTKKYRRDFELNNEMPKKIIILVLGKEPKIYLSLEDYIRSLTYYRATKLISQIKSIKHIR